MHADRRLPACRRPACAAHAALRQSARSGIGRRRLDSSEEGFARDARSLSPLTPMHIRNQNVSGTLKAALRTRRRPTPTLASSTNEMHKQPMTMSTRYPTTNPVDRIFLGIANVTIVCAGAVVLYHCVVTSIAPPPYKATAVAMSSGVDNALPTTMARLPTPAACVHCLPASIVR